MLELKKYQDFEKMTIVRRIEYVGKLTEEKGYHISNTDFKIFCSCYGEIYVSAMLMAETRRRLKGWNSALRQFKKRFGVSIFWSKIVLVGEWLEQYGVNISKEKYEDGCQKYGEELVKVLLIAQLRRKEDGWIKAITIFDGKYNQGGKLKR